MWHGDLGQSLVAGGGHLGLGCDALVSRVLSGFLATGEVRSFLVLRKLRDLLLFLMVLLGFPVSLSWWKAEWSEGKGFGSRLEEIYWITPVVVAKGALTVFGFLSTYNLVGRSRGVNV